MKCYSRLASASALVLAPLSYGQAQEAGKNLALDFRTTIVVSGMTDTSVLTGRAVGTADRMRLDLKMKMQGTGTAVGMLANDGEVSMIVTDSGKTITYLDSKNSQYIKVRPTDMVLQAQQMGGMKMDFSGTEARVDNLGAGPGILGHPTSHYRVATGMTMKISAMGQEQTVKISSTTDTYYANDIKGDLNPFASLSGGDMANMFGTTNKEFADKMKAVQAKLPKGVPLRAVSSSTLTAHGETKVTNSQAEVTSIQWVPYDSKTYEVPSTYTAAPMPGMGAPAGGAIPPR